MGYSGNLIKMKISIENAENIFKNASQIFPKL
jgi:hypothetical protein